MSFTPNIEQVVIYHNNYESCYGNIFFILTYIGHMLNIDTNLLFPRFILVKGEYEFRKTFRRLFVLLRFSTMGELSEWWILKVMNTKLPFVLIAEGLR